MYGQEININSEHLERIEQYDPCTLDIWEDEEEGVGITVNKKEAVYLSKILATWAETGELKEE